MLPVSWAAAALASASVSTWAHRFIVSGPILVTLGLILTEVGANDRFTHVWRLRWRSLRSVRELGWRGALISGSLLIEFAEPNERDIAAAFISTVNLISTGFWRGPRRNHREYCRLWESHARFDRGRCMRSSGFVPDDPALFPAAALCSSPSGRFRLSNRVAALSPTRWAIARRKREPDQATKEPACLRHAFCLLGTRQSGCVCCSSVAGRACR